MARTHKIHPQRRPRPITNKKSLTLKGPQKVKHLEGAFFYNLFKKNYLKSAFVKSGLIIYAVNWIINF